MTANRLEEPWHEILRRPLDLDRLEILELKVPQVRPFKSAIGERHERRALLVRWWAPDGSWGIGECSCRPDPFFSGEFVDGAFAVLRDFIRPMLPAKGSFDDRAKALGRIRGWPFTVAAVLDAAFDLERRQGRPDALDLLAVKPLEKVPVGISLGLFDSSTEAVTAVAEADAEGYCRIKMKISPAMRRETLDAVREAHPNIALAFDANGSCGEKDLDFLVSLGRLEPEAIEQPFAPDRLDLCADLKQSHPKLRITLDESLGSLGAVRSAERIGALDEINVKPGRVGGQLETCRILDHCLTHGRAAWVGGMFETGIGRKANLRVAARLHDALAHDLSPSRRYFSRDIVARPLDMDADGTIDLLDDSPIELDDSALDDMTVRRLEI